MRHFILKILLWLPRKTRIDALMRLPTRWITRNFTPSDDFATLQDIFHKKITWPLDYLERVLTPADTEIWDYVSVWYTLTDAFCERNVEWLNFYELVYSQTLSRAFYLRHMHRVDWLPSAHRKRDELYRMFYTTPSSGDECEHFSVPANLAGALCAAPDVTGIASDATVTTTSSDLATAASDLATAASGLPSK